MRNIVGFQVKEGEPKVWGLTYTPIFSDMDGEVIAPNGVQIEMSDRNLTLIKETVKGMNNPSRILEIGVHRNEDRSSTTVLLRHKNPETYYFGVDVEDKSYLDDRGKRISTIRRSSSDYMDVLNWMYEISFGYSLDILLIDGWHSINQCLRDWRYAHLVKPMGYVILHDTNYHLGPASLFDAIDSNLFEKSKYFDGENDWGMAVAVAK